jgi:hypothetical protein
MMKSAEKIKLGLAIFESGGRDFDSCQATTTKNLVNIKFAGFLFLWKIS